MTEEEKAFVLLHKNTPIVGLIHKETFEIVLAPCILPKVSLQLNAAGKAVSGCFTIDNTPINNVQLDEFNVLIKKGHVPRFAYTHDSSEVTSSHEFLFQQKCKLTQPSQWGGFSLTVTSSDILTHTFTSGAFNSSSGKRTRGAELSIDLMIEVKKRTANLVTNPQYRDKSKDYESPIKKRPCFSETSFTRYSKLSNAKNGVSFFSTDVAGTLPETSRDNPADLSQGCRA